MKRIDSQRGQGRIGVVICLALAGAAVFAAVKYIPVKVAAYEFHDVVRQEARYAATRDADSTVTDRILEKAAELEIPLARKDVRVMRTRNEVTIDVRYDQPIDFKVTTYTYRFHASEQAPLF